MSDQTARALRRARAKARLTQQDAAEYCHVHVATYQRWENGDAEPNPHVMRNFVEHCDKWAKIYAEHDIAGIS